MIPRPSFRSTITTPFGAVWGMLAGILFVFILLRIADRGAAFGRWLASHNL